MGLNHKDVSCIQAFCCDVHIRGPSSDYPAHTVIVLKGWPMKTLSHFMQAVDCNVPFANAAC